MSATVLEAVYAKGLDPRDERVLEREQWADAARLGAGPRDYRTPEEIYRESLAREPHAGPERRSQLKREAESCARQNVSFFDATFSVAKSVTVLAVAFERSENDARAAAARHENAGDLAAAAESHQEAAAWGQMRETVEKAVMAGATAAVNVLEEKAGYSRVGRHGGGAGRWIDAHRFVVAQFLQHDSRDKDPQLHVHQAILNRVLCADGTWRTIDGKGLYAHKRAADAHGERVMEARLTEWLGVRVETRPDGKVREIVGVDKAVMDLFSRRRRAVSQRVEKLIDAYRERNGGRQPSPLERFHIAQQATLETRKRKSESGETQDERLERWSREARESLEGGLARVSRDVLAAGRDSHAPAQWEPQAVIDRALDRVRSSATWTRSDLTFAISQALPGNLRVPASKIGDLLEGLTDKALEQVVPTVQRESTEKLAPQFTLADGRSALQRPGAERYATKDQMAAEYVLDQASITKGAAAMSREQAVAVANRYAENGKELGSDQREALIGVLTSGAKVEALVAAAGAGKSFVVGAIAEAWEENGLGKALGLTPSQVAAKVLTEEGVTSMNLSAWKGAQRRLDEGRGSERDQKARLGKGDLLVVDEAGMAATPDLKAVVERATDRVGAKVLFVGDPRQLASVGAGGALGDVRAKRYELTEVRRFDAAWEGEASLRLRDADPAALEQYDKHGRIRAAGTPEQAQAKAAEAWLSDTLAGKESLLLVSSNEDASQVSAQLRAELVRLGRVSEDGVILGRDGTMAGAGDQIQARRNGWDLIGHDGNTRAPINRETYRVTATHEDGSMTVQDSAGVPIRLAPAYVAEHVALAYASTVHAAQGRTVDTSHGVVDPGSQASSVYVQLTRGRQDNTAWVVTRPTASDAPVGDATNVKEIPAMAVVAGVLERAEQERGALAERAQDQEDAASTFRNVDRLADSIDFALAGRTSAVLDRLVHNGVLSAEDREGLAGDQAIRAVDRLIRSAEVAGHNPEQVLQEALDGQDLSGARAPAQVLHARIRDNLNPAAPAITSYRDLIPEGASEQMRAQMERFADAADDRRHVLGQRVAEEAPAWAVNTLGPVPEDPLARAEWETRAGWAAAHRENMKFTDEDRPLGAAPAPGLAEKRAVWATAHRALGLPDTSPEEDAMSDGRLRERVEAYEREKLWAPRYVADELAATAEAAADRARDAERWAARAGENRDENLSREAENARREAADLELKRQQLEQVDKTRAQWVAQTATTRDLAERARATLEGRGMDVDDPSRKVTGEEWVDAHRAERADSEPHRQVTEDDVHEEPADELATGDSVDGPTLETQVPDIRDTATKDDSEDRDPAREVPADDAVAEATDKARDTLLELQARHDMDTAHDEELEDVVWWADDADDVDDDADVDERV